MVKKEKKDKKNASKEAQSRQDGDDEPVQKLFPIRRLPSLGSVESFAKLRRRSGLFTDTSQDVIATTSTVSIAKPEPKQRGPEIPLIIVTSPDSETSFTGSIAPSTATETIFKNFTDIEEDLSFDNPNTKGKKSEKGRKGAVLKSYGGRQHSDLDVQTTRPPMIHLMNNLEWMFLYNTKSRLSIVILASLFCVVLVHLGFAIWLFSLGEKVENPRICDTDACKKLGTRLMARLNRSVNPCNDFYAFVCGTSDISRDLPEKQETNWRYLNDAGRVFYNFHKSFSLGRMLSHTKEFPHKLVLSMYQACLQEDEREKQGLQPYYDLLKKLNLYHISKDMTLTGTQVIESMAKILAHSMYESAILTVGYYKDTNDHKIKTYIGPSIVASSPFRGGFVYRYGYQLYHDTIKNAFKLLKELNLSDEEMDILPHDILCLDIYLRDLFIPKEKISVLENVFAPDPKDSKGRKPCELGLAYTGTNPQANFGQPGSGDFDYELLIKTMYAVANPGWNIASDPIPPEYAHTQPRNDPRTVYQNVFMESFEELFKVSAPIRLLRYLQWRVLVMMSLELDDKTIGVMINVRRHVYLGDVQNCFHALFRWLPFTSPDKFLHENSGIGSKKMDEAFYKHSEQLKSAYHRLVVGSDFKEFQKFLGKGFDDRDLTLLREILLSYLRVEDIPPTTFRSENFPDYPKLYEGISFDRNTHFENLLKVGHRMHQWKANPQFSKIFYNISSTYHLPIWIDKTRSRYDSVENFHRTYLPLASIEDPFFHDGLAVSDTSGLGSVLGKANSKSFIVSMLYISEHTTHIQDLTKNINGQTKYIYVEKEIIDMQENLRRWVIDFLENVAFADQLKTWELGKDISQKIKYKSGRRRIFDALMLDIGRFRPLAAAIDEFLRKPENKKEAQYILKGLEEYDAKQLFYISMVERLCEKFGQKEYDHISQYGPLPQSIRNNLVLSNLDDFVETFQCPAGAPMNARVKVHFWDKNVDISKHNVPLSQGRFLDSGIDFSVSDDDDE